MSKWSRVKIAVLSATTLAALGFGGCLGMPSMQRIFELVAIGNIFD